MAVVLASGEVSAGRSDTLACSAINLSGFANDVHVTILDAAGTVLDDEDCLSAADGDVCVASYKNPSPIAAAAFCYVTARHAQVAGALRLDSPTNVSKAVSDLQRLTPLPSN